MNKNDDHILFGVIKLQQVHIKFSVARVEARTVLDGLGTEGITA